jgi:3-mercaptopyruvate sulfurtransferase SseA
VDSALLRRAIASWSDRGAFGDDDVKAVCDVFRGVFNVGHTFQGAALQDALPTDAQGNVTAGDVIVVHDDLYAGGRPVLTADDISDGAVTTVLDARAPERFRGELEPVDPVAGHIPGARNLPSMAVLGPDGRFLPDVRLAALVDEIGVGDSAGVYCGSGVTASVVLAALNIVGVHGALFPGSWSQWSGEDRPVERGPAT